MFWGILQTWQSVVTAAQEAKCPDPVVNRDDNDAAPVGHLLPIVQGVSQECHIVGRSQQEGSSEQINHHREVGGHWWRNRAIHQSGGRTLCYYQLAVTHVLC